MVPVDPSSAEELEGRLVVEASAAVVVVDLFVEGCVPGMVEDLFEEEDLRSMAMVAQLAHSA